MHHVGLYIGEGKMVHAPHTGSHVQIAPMSRSDYAGAVRPSLRGRFDLNFSS
ncbi:NlpC/P60 family protein [Microbispora sp. CSR-4]|uniref:NlpC/P60 family protein n=1 Tax=Microbispora sp. CSR-4 TaxID=2592813 RepID=UPI0021C5EDE7|nr:NlpC/P60 family protein [Microbispora sp. CSR-4]